MTWCLPWLVANIAGLRWRGLEEDEGPTLPGEKAWWAAAIYLGGISLAAMAPKRWWWAMPLAWLWPLLIWAVLAFVR